MSRELNVKGNVPRSISVGPCSGEEMDKRFVPAKGNVGKCGPVDPSFPSRALDEVGYATSFWSPW